MQALLIGSVFRHVLSAIGGAGVAVGLAPDAPAQVGDACLAGDPSSPEVIAGAASILIAAALSFWQKRQARAARPAP